METGIFPDKTKVPTDDELKASLGHVFDLWKDLRSFVLTRYPAAMEEWSYPGKKYGWSFRIKDKKRAIIYLLPRHDYFQVAFVFGQKAADKIDNSEISTDIKLDLQNAKAYVEGRGIRIEVKDSTKMVDIKKLIEIKLAN